MVQTATRRPRACATSTVCGVRNATSRLSVDGSSASRSADTGGSSDSHASQTSASGSTERTVAIAAGAPHQATAVEPVNPATVRAATRASSASVRSTSRVDRHPSSRSSAPSSRGIRSRPLPSRATSHQSTSDTRRASPHIRPRVSSCSKTATPSAVRRTSTSITSAPSASATAMAGRVFSRRTRGAPRWATRRGGRTPGLPSGLAGTTCVTGTGGLVVIRACSRTRANRR